MSRSTALILISILSVQYLMAERWLGLEVRPDRGILECGVYDRTDYGSGHRKEEAWIAREIGAILSPYDGARFDSIRETEVEHIVALGEAHRSGLCEVDNRTRKRFAADPLNLTLAGPILNRRKSDQDAADWMPDPPMDCWFADRVIRVKRKYGLSVDSRERDELASVIARCDGMMTMPALWIEGREYE